MTVKQFIEVCITNTAEITIADKHDNELYNDMIYLFCHNHGIDKAIKEKILLSNIEAWGLSSAAHEEIFIATDFEKS